MLKNRKKKGFTLIELIVVIAILGILAAVLIPRFGGFQDKARRTQVVTDGKQLATAIDSLLAESTTGVLDAAHGLEAVTNTPATIAANEAVILSGITPTRITELTINADGSFTFTSSVANSAATPVHYVAARTAVTAEVTVTP